jgi:UDP-N-acetylmuramoyl-L-alanyl-D-glutamate--2,6-diaminopimelate ligase
MMTLDRLLGGIVPQIEGLAVQVPVTGVCVDSRAVQPGSLFVALRGVHTDGHDHVREAAQSGAAAILAERPVDAGGIPVVRVASTLESLSPISARFFGYPSKGLDVVGITGTNGKTTISYMLEHLWRLEGRRAGVLGTIEYRWPGHAEPAPNTTPQSIDVQRLLAAMGQERVTHVAMEVSSHALSLHRVDDVSLAVGVFTNLTQDHLDFHKSMEGYFDAKS